MTREQAQKEYEQLLNRTVAEKRRIEKMNPWDETLTIFDKDLWIRGFVLALAAEYLNDGGNAVKLIQNRASIANMIAGVTSGIPKDENGIHENIARSWVDAGGGEGDWYREFDQLLREVTFQ